MNIPESVAPFLYFFLLFQLLNKCNGSGPCIYDGNPKGVIDLTSVGRVDGTPRWKDAIPTMSDGHIYSYNPCQSFSEGKCENVAACQTYGEDHSLNYPLGSQNSIQWLPNGDDPPAMRYNEGGRTLQVNMRCLTGGEADSLEVHGYDATVQLYVMILSSACACWDKCKGGSSPAPSTTPGTGPGPGPKPPSGLTMGGVIIIILVALIFVYLVSFILFNKYKRQASGLDILPHRAFWGSLPGLALGGVRFIFAKVTGKSEYKSIR